MTLEKIKKDWLPWVTSITLSLSVLCYLVGYVKCMAVFNVFRINSSPLIVYDFQSLFTTGLFSIISAISYPTIFFLSILIMKTICKHLEKLRNKKAKLLIGSIKLFFHDYTTKWHKITIVLFSFFLYYSFLVNVCVLLHGIFLHRIILLPDIIYNGFGIFFIGTLTFVILVLYIKQKSKAVILLILSLYMIFAISANVVGFCNTIVQRNLSGDLPSSNFSNEIPGAWGYIYLNDDMDAQIWNATEEESPNICFLFNIKSNNYIFIPWFYTDGYKNEYGVLYTVPYSKVRYFMEIHPRYFDDLRYFKE